MTQGLKGFNTGSNNPMWKGDCVGYNGLHDWVKARFPKPEYCECCHMSPPQDLANKGVYNRDLNNWEWLCRKCHMVKDGRIKELAAYHREDFKGEGNPRAKLSLEQVIQIKTLKGLSQAQLARKFGVSTTAIQLILNGRNWKCVQANSI